MERFIEIGDGGNGGNLGDGMKLLRHDVGARREGEGHHLACRCVRPLERSSRHATDYGDSGTYNFNII